MQKRNDKVLIGLGFLIIFIYYMSMLLVKETTNLDELWNYNIARNIAKGLIPYKDISLITTPLLPLIEGVILKIIPNELIAFRVLNATLITVILYLTYRIYRKLNVKEVASVILTLPLIWILKDEIFLDYNFLILLIALILILLELRLIKKETTVRQEILIGLCAGLAVCTKQTIGLIICADILVMPLIIKRSWKEIRNIGYRLIGLLIPIVLLAMYLLVTGSFYDFLSYTFLAINTFSNSISYDRLLYSSDFPIQMLAVIMPIITILIMALLVWSGKSKREKDIYKEIEVVFLCGLPLLLTQYPIADRLHFLLSNYIMIVLVLFIIYYFIKKQYKIIKSDIKKFVVMAGEIFFVLCGVFYITVNIAINSLVYIKAEKNTELKYYNNLIVPDYIHEMYNKLDSKERDYENQGKSANMLDSNAAAIHIPMDKYIKNYDMFNKGNFGKDGEDGLIEQIKEKDNQVYFIRKDSYKNNWQNPTKVTDYIKNNLKKIDEIEMYDIYEK